jgi:hypothetical protein
VPYGQESAVAVAWWAFAFCDWPLPEPKAIRKAL